MSVYEDKFLIGECKWKNEKVGMSVIEKLLERGELFSHKDKKYVIFSKSGFSKEAMEYASVNENIKLVDFEKMCEEGSA